MSENQSGVLKGMRCVTVGSRRLRVVVLMAAVLATSCSTNSGEDGNRVTPETKQPLPYSYGWSADPGVDLFSRGAELVRATEEAGQLSFFAGLDHSFPGYRAAIGGPVDHLDPDKMDAVGLVQPKGIPVESTNYRHITNFVASDDAVAATLCTYKAYANDGDNRLTTRFGRTRIELENVGTSAGTPGTPDTDPDRENPAAHDLPDWNVFGSWKIRVFKTDIPEPVECDRWWHSQFPELPFDPETDRIDVPHGFRVPTQPVAVQYPEWIGPADNG